MFAANQFVYSNAGILRLSELVPASTQLGSSFDVPIANINIQNLNSSTPLCRLRSGEGTCLRSIRIQEGKEILCGTETKILCYRENTLQPVVANQIREKDLLVYRLGSRIASDRFSLTRGALRCGFRFELRPSTFELLGCLGSLSKRIGSWCLLVTSPGLVQQVQTLAEEIGLPLIFNTPIKFSRFSGIYRLSTSEELTELVLWSKSPAFLRLLRKATLELQKHWLTGITMTLGRWTCNSLEFETENFEVAETLNLLLNNFGVKTHFYPTLDVYGKNRFKVAFVDQDDFDLAVEAFWNGRKLPCPWKNRESKSSSWALRPVVKKLGLSCENQLELDEYLTDKDHFVLKTLNSPGVRLVSVHEAKTIPTVNNNLIKVVVPKGSAFLVNGFVVQN